ncbi:MAG TPA: hypothetical protein VG675_10630 [Bryobacteraceae bacterium]|nr:hypothetical protein [Bryobacteraceae bacterium]
MSAGTFVAFIVLLLLGTEILDWRWATLVPLAAAAIGVYRIRQKLPSLYTVAQIVDHRMGLADTISTALFFSRDVSPEASSRTRQLQRESADRMAETVDVRRAVPYTMPRAAYWMAGLALVASSLFALRYGLDQRLDLKPSLAHILQQSFGFQKKVQEAKAETPKLPKEADPPAEAEQQSSEPMASADKAQEAATPANSDTRGQAQSKAESAEPNREQASAQAESDPPDDPNSQNSDSSKSGEQGDQDSSSSSSGQKQASGSQDGGSGENSSLLSKVRDAMQNLLSHMKNQAGASGTQQAAAAQSGKQSRGQQKSGQQQSKSGDRQQGSEAQASAEGQPGSDQQSSLAAQAGAGKSNSQQASKMPGSGIGSQDGNKELKQAEQLAAMGKISEIIGKRSANVSGEATVEVQSGEQQLSTPYTHRLTQHSEGGAEINRDEVPVAVQAYVEQYFEQVHRRPAQKK